MPMKKNFTFLFYLLANLAVQAQTEFPLQFVDKDGQIIPDGTELDLTDIEVDDLFGDILVPTNVWVKNVSTAMVQGGGTYTIQAISNGWFQTCFPMNCIRKSGTGTFSTESAPFTPNQLTSLQTEWLPDGEGVCVVTYQLQTFRQNPNNHKWQVDADGPKITLNFFNGTTAIKRSSPDPSRNGGEIYDLGGRKINSQLSTLNSQLKKGLYIINGKKYCANR